MGKKALVIGAGGVSNVVCHKCAQNSEVFSSIMIASRRKVKCDEIKERIEKSKYAGRIEIQTGQVDANNVPELVALINEYKPDIVINVALPYQDLTIMDACLETKTDYLDTANYEPLDTAKFEYKWQWAYKEKFEKELKNLVSLCQKKIGKTGIKAKIWIDPKYYAGKKIKVFYDSLDGKTQLSKVDEHILMIYLEMFEKELSGKGFLAINEEIDIHNYDFAEYSNMEKEKEASVTYAKMAFSICGEKPEIKMIEPFLSIYLVFTDKTYEKYEEEIMKLYYTFYEYF